MKNSLNKEKFNLVAAVFIMFFVLLMSYNDANAQIPFEFTQIKLSGSGCPEGSYSVVTSPDNQALSILFDRFQVNAPLDPRQAPGGGRRVDLTINQMVCDIIIMANLKEGEMVESLGVQLDLRGAVSLDPRAQALVHTQFLEWTGPRGVGAAGRTLIAEKKWYNGTSAGVDEDWSISENKNVITDRPHCARGHDRALKFVLKNVLMTRIDAASPNSIASMQVDSADMAGSLKFRIVSRGCGGAPSVGNGNGNGHGRGNGGGAPGVGPGVGPGPRPGVGNGPVPGVGGGAPSVRGGGPVCPPGTFYDPSFRACRR